MKRSWSSTAILPSPWQGDLPRDAVERLLQQADTEEQQAKPATAGPMEPRRWLAPVRRSSMPTPTSATSQPVMVEPTLAPNSTHSAGESPSRPALMKPMGPP